MNRVAWWATVHGVTKESDRLEQLNNKSYMERVYSMISSFHVQLIPWHYFASKGPSSQSYGFSSSHVWMWELDHKESWVPKNWCLWTVVLKTLESPLDCMEIKPVHRKGNQSWIFIGRTDAEAEAPILWPPDAKNWLIGKDLDAGKDWRQEEKGTTEDEMAGWHHRLSGHESEQILGNSERQGNLACYSPWGRKESDSTEWLNWTEGDQGEERSQLESCGRVSR